MWNVTLTKGEANTLQLKVQPQEAEGHPWVKQSFVLLVQVPCVCEGSSPSDTTHFLLFFQAEEPTSLDILPLGKIKSLSLPLPCPRATGLVFSKRKVSKMNESQKDHPVLPSPAPVALSWK